MTENPGAADTREYISLTDIARHWNPAEPEFLICTWMREVNTLQFLCLWEELNNPGFRRADYDEITKDATSQSFMISPRQWIEDLGGTGLAVSSGSKSKEIYVHEDIAYEFASWISPEFKLLMIKAFQNLRKTQQRELEWSSKQDILQALAKERAV